MKRQGRWVAEIETQVQFYDLDPMEVVWHGHYVKYLEIARCALLDRIGYNYAQMKHSGYAWPVIDMHIRYASSATFGQRLKLRAEIVEWENRLKIRLFDHRCHDGAPALARQHHASRRGRLDVERCVLSRRRCCSRNWECRRHESD